MKTIKKNILRSALALSILMTASCADWLDVKPKTSISDAELFSREEGFMEALTGIYIQMSGTDLYGRELSYGIPDILAQCYEPSDDRGGGGQISFKDPDWYKFPSDKTRQYIDDVWNRMYSTIANVNNFLTWLDRNRHVVTTEGYYEIMKGEALGLRAFLYTDLLRLYGPIYGNPGGSVSLTLPYRTQFSRGDVSLSTAEEVTLLIEKDIKAAEELLKNDPMYLQFITDDNPPVLGRDPFLIARYKRMNLYAVKGLAARMYLWKGDKANAAKYAQEVLDAEHEDGDPMFQLVQNNINDRVFSTEILFSMSVDELEEQAEEDFANNMTTKYMVAVRSRIDLWYDIARDGSNDMRYRQGQGFEVTATSTFSVKYYQPAAFSPDIQNTIPLIRLSEMYYILAECADNLETTRLLLSSVREARGGDPVRTVANAEQKQEEIMKEYRKEFYAEGQIWYYYKRNAMKTFLHCPLETDMTEANYRFTLPENEVEFGNY